MAEIRDIDKKFQIGIFGCVVVIMILTILELPAPVGFETRPQSNVSMGWLFFFLVIVVTEIATIFLIFKKTNLGIKFGMTAGVLNILQVIADQLRLMQPEAAPTGYALLEYTVVIVSIMLICIAFKLSKTLKEKSRANRREL